MSDAHPAWIILFFVLILIDFIFYGFGAALQNLDHNKIEDRFRERKDKSSRRLLQMSDDPSKYINTVQFVVTLIQIVLGGFFLSIWRSNMQKVIYQVILKKSTAAEHAIVVAVVAAVIAALVMIYLIQLLGVVIPKKIASRHPEKWAYACLPITYYVCILLTPVTYLINKSADLVLRIFGMKQTRDASDVTEAEIISMVNEGHEQGILEESEAEMITNIFEFGDKTARDIMTNRQNMIMLDAHMNLSEAIQFMLDENNSRYPVYQNTPDQIIGIMHLKDACRYEKKLQQKGEEAEHKEPEANRRNEKRINTDPTLKQCRSILRRPEYVPETMNIDDLFHIMQMKKLQMAIIVDEYGQTVGLVAMEDILEEIVGNIQDEYDEEEKHIQKLAEGRYRADGMTPLEDLEDTIGLSFTDDIEVETLNGFMILQMEHIPEGQEEFECDYGGFHFKVLGISKRMVNSILIVKNLPKVEVEEAAE